MSPLDTLPWEGIREYGMGYPTKYTTSFRVVDKTIERLRSAIIA